MLPWICGCILYSKSEILYSILVQYWIIKFHDSYTSHFHLSLLSTFSTALSRRSKRVLLDAYHSLEHNSGRCLSCLPAMRRFSLIAAVIRKSKRRVTSRHSVSHLVALVHPSPSKGTCYALAECKASICGQECCGPVPWQLARLAWWAN